MALTKVIGNGLGTLGDGTANDTKIVFDGNAQDYHIGLDDSADALVIGKGSALGTTTSMSFDENGIVTKPLQPAFFVQSSTASNLSTNASYTVAFGTEVFDQNGDFASNTFTAPVTGKYQLNFSARIDNIDDATQYTNVVMVTSNREISMIHGNSGYDADVNYMGMMVSALVDMDANDTATMRIDIPSLGTAQADLTDVCRFSGYLVC